jgi:glutamyl-tRNA reductase
MYYFLISFSHKNTDIIVRDKISFNHENEQKEILKKLKEHSIINEIMLLSTCNRIEFFGVSFSPKDSINKILETLAQKSGLEKEYLQNLAFIYEDKEAIYHMFSVISSLDSLVIGETQIVGQLKDSFKLAVSNNFAGQKISRAIHYGFKCSASVRKDTKISTQKVSIASVAVSLAEERVSNFESKKALIIGSGEISRLIAQYLDSHNIEITLLNRTKQKAQVIADEVREKNENSKIKVKSFVDLNEIFNNYDFIFTATSSESEIIKIRDIQSRNFHRYWFDLAVPKDIENTQNTEFSEKISLFRIDDLEQLVNRNIAERENEVRKAHGIVGRFSEDFFNWISSLSVQPILKELYSKAEKNAIEEVQRAVSKKFISESEQANVEKVAIQTTKKLLHGLSKRLKATTKSPSFDLIAESLDYLFDLNILQGGYNAKNSNSHQKSKSKHPEHISKGVSNQYKCEHMIAKEKSLVEEF